MAVGLPLKTTYANGDVYSASDVNDTNGTVNLFTSSTLSRAGGKNALINGGMDIWQRGTSFAASGSNWVYTADRWAFNRGSYATGATASRQTTSDTTNLPFIQYGLRVQRDSGNTSTTALQMAQTLETSSSYPFIGQNVVFSFWARRGANYSATSNIMNSYVATGTGTDQNANTFTGYAVQATGTHTLTTTWQRFTVTASIPSTVTQIAVLFTETPTGTAGAADWFEVTGCQLELGSTATTFSRAGGTIQNELAACQRYYFRQVANAAGNAYFGNGHARNTTTDDVGLLQAPVEMRVVPTSVDYSTLKLTDGATNIAITSLTIGGECNTISFKLNVSVASGLTAYRPYDIAANSSSSAYLGFSAEL
jgi:hypothetical protein